MMKLLGCLVGLTLMVSAAASASTLPNVEIIFGDRIVPNLQALNDIEFIREKRFRIFRQEGASPRVKSLSRSRGFYGNTKFGNERLVPNLKDFSLETLTHAMVAYDFALVEGKSDEHTLRVEIDNFYLSAYSLAKFNSFSSRMKGRISIVDLKGNIIRTEEISANLLPHYTINRNYKGKQFAYSINSEDTRYAPLLARFLEKGLEKLYPDTDIPGPIFILG